MQCFKYSMAKKRSWFGWVKKLFNSESKTRTEKESKRWRWVFGRLKFIQCPALTAPQKTWNDTTEEQRKQALDVAMATAAAAEAAVAAAHAAAEVVRLIGTSKSYNHFAERQRNSAAIKIQSAFRAHLARKALRALKGLVKLQAIVRGRAVRRQVITTLKWLPSNAKRQSEVQERCSPKANCVCKNGENKKCLGLKEELGEKDIKQPECNGQRSWDRSVLSKDDMKSILLRKQEALIKRERMMKYSYSHRERSVHMLEESMPWKENGKWSCWLEKRAESEILKPVVDSNLIAGEIYVPTQVKLRHMRKQGSQDALNSPISFARRSFSQLRENNTFGDNCPVLNSPVFPTYMAATQSAKAKRSMSTPKQRVTYLDTCFDHRVPSYRNELSLWSSYNGEPFTRNRKSGDAQQLSMSMNSHY
ncbi:hypothetical protein Dsin_011903 [Dipteronia sinensis]|uniref:DUF4005 domain-containing protein n=1 Tax=Dipteronia sinensis TaxID=43782 RepID=A0AAE0AH09_9ROSI|nr:hypothetical protein Dsin_011903 [Dipteronia sinensis]